MKGKPETIPFAWKLPKPSAEAEARAEEVLGRNYSLFRLLRHGNDKERRKAEALLLRNNEPLISYIIRRYGKRGLPMGDLLNSGRQGLLKAIRCFDYSLGIKFSTYAYDWIRQAVQRMSENEGGTIRIPVHMQQSVSLLRETLEMYTLKFGRPPSDKQLAKILGWKVKKLRQVMEASLIQVVSFDAVLKGTDNVLMSDRVSAETVKVAGPIWEGSTSLSPEDQLEQLRHDEMIRQQVDALLHDPRISELERFVLAARFGIGMPEHKLQDVGDKLGCTKEWVRQIEKKALAKLASKDPPEEFIPRSPRPRRMIKMPVTAYKRKEQSLAKAAV